MTKQKEVVKYQSAHQVFAKFIPGDPSASRPSRELDINTSEIGARGKDLGGEIAAAFKLKVEQRCA